MLGVADDAPVREADGTRRAVEDGRLDTSKETVVLNTGEGLKTLDPLEPVVGPTHRVDPSLKSARASGLIG